jgi:hypothetical protein
LESGIRKRRLQELLDEVPEGLEDRIPEILVELADPAPRPGYWAIVPI